MSNSDELLNASAPDPGEDTPVTEDNAPENAGYFGSEGDGPAEEVIILGDVDEGETSEEGTYGSAVQTHDDTESVPKELRAETESSSAVDPVSGFSVPGWLIGGLAGAAIGAGVTAGIVALVLSNRRRRHRKKPVSGDGPGEAVQQQSRTQLPGAGARQFEIFVGKVHETGARVSQQDSFAVSDGELLMDKGLLAVVADGMGGLSDGDRVSQTATEAMMEGFYSVGGKPEEVLLELLSKANSAVNRLLEPEGIGKSGSTMAVSLIREGKFYYLSVGDSRIVLLRDGVLYQLNREHIYRNELAVNAINGQGTLQGAFTHLKGGAGFPAISEWAHSNTSTCPRSRWSCAPGTGLF